MINHKEKEYLKKKSRVAKRFFNIYLYSFIWLCQVLVVAHGILDLCYHMQDLELQHAKAQWQYVECSFLTRDLIQAPCVGHAEC